MALRHTNNLSAVQLRPQLVTRKLSVQGSILQM